MFDFFVFDPKFSIELHALFFVFYFWHILGDNEHHDGSGENSRKTSNGAENAAG